MAPMRLYETDAEREADAEQAHIWEWDSGHGTQTMVSAHAHRPGRCLGRDPQRVEDVSLDWEEQGF